MSSTVKVLNINRKIQIKFKLISIVTVELIATYRWTASIVFHYADVESEEIVDGNTPGSDERRDWRGMQGGLEPRTCQRYPRYTR